MSVVARRLSWVLSAILVAILASPVFSADAVKETILPNGLRILTKEVHAAPVVTAQVWYRVGSRNEHAGITGYSHLLEHMVFKGTKTYKKGEVTKMIRKMGGIDNAGTWTDFTYFWQLLSSDHLEFALKTQADSMANSLIDAKELKAEMVVVRSELEGRESSPDSLLWEDTTAATFKAHPYQWPVIGWRSDVEGVNRDILYQYYRTYYHPNNATLVIVGDFDTAQAIALARKYFSGIPKGSAPPPVRTVEPQQFGERRIKLEKQGSAERVMIGYHVPGIKSADTFPLIVLDQLLSGGKSSRLYQALVEQQLATEAWSSISPRIDPSAFFLGGTARVGVTAQQIEKALLQQAEDAKTKPISDEEMARAKNQLEASFIFSKDSVSDQAEQLGYYATVADWRIVDQYVAKVKAVTKEQVQDVAQKYLTEMNRTVGWFIPTAELDRGQSGPPPTATSAAPGTVGSLRPDIAAYRAPGRRGRDEDAPLTATAPKPKAVAGRASTKAKPFRAVLPNGVVVIIQENHSNQTVAIRGNLKAGGVFDPKGKNGLASITASMLSRGTATRTALQLAAEAESVGASVSVAGGTESASFSGSALSKDFTKITELLADILRNPSFPQEQLEKLRGQSLSGLEQEKESPDSRAQRMFYSLVFPQGHPYHQQTVDADAQDVKSITRQDVLDFYGKYYGPDTAVIVIVGDVSRDAALGAVKEYFGSWTARGQAQKVEIPDAPLQAKAIKEVIPMPDKSEVSVTFGHAGMLARSNPDFYAANVMNQVLGGGGALSSRLGNIIRENMGLVYDVYSTFEPTLGEGPWYVALGTNPMNADKAVTAMKSEIAKMRDKGATATEANDAIGFITGFFPIRLETNGGVAQTLLNSEFYGLGMDYIRNYSKLYHAVTLKQVNAAAKKYLHPDRATLVISGAVKQ